MLKYIQWILFILYNDHHVDPHLSYIQHLRDHSNLLIFLKKKKTISFLFHISSNKIQITFSFHFSFSFMNLISITNRSQQFQDLFILLIALFIKKKNHSNSLFFADLSVYLKQPNKREAFKKILVKLFFS